MALLPWDFVGLEPVNYPVVGSPTASDGAFGRFDYGFRAFGDDAGLVQLSVKLFKERASLDDLFQNPFISCLGVKRVLPWAHDLLADSLELGSGLMKGGYVGKGANSGWGEGLASNLRTNGLKLASKGL